MQQCANENCLTLGGNSDDNDNHNNEKKTFEFWETINLIHISSGKYTKYSVVVVVFFGLVAPFVIFSYTANNKH